MIKLNINLEKNIKIKEIKFKQIISYWYCVRFIHSIFKILILKVLFSLKVSQSIHKFLGDGDCFPQNKYTKYW